MKRWFYPVVALQVLFLVGEATSYQMQISRAPVVTLKVRPVDPRSLFMGNYMALDYEICDINLSAVRHDPRLANGQWGDTVYVTLIPGKPGARVESVTTSLPPARQDRPCLRAEFITVTGFQLRVFYGLDRYYIPETAQEQVNRLWWRPGKQPPQVTAEIAILGKGKAVIRGVLVDGKPLKY